MASPPTSPKPKRPTRLPPSPLNPDVLLPENQAALEQGQGHEDTLGVGLGRPALSPPAASADGRRKSSAARDLLRKHYGLGAGPSTRLGSHPADPMDLDSTAFDARAYYEQLITTSSLPALLKRENELLSEIRQLDSDRQSLVYNHHHELIAASDTIGAMKLRAESLDGDLDALKAAFSEISRLSAEVATERPTTPSARSVQAGRKGRSSPTPATP